VKKIIVVQSALYQKMAHCEEEPCALCSPPNHATETCQILKLDFRDETMIKIQALDWFPKIHVKLDNNAEYSGCPFKSKTDVNVNSMKEVFHEDRHITSHDLTNEVGISLGSCQSNT
jgi:hypothetical protein